MICFPTAIFLPLYPHHATPFQGLPLPHKRKSIPLPYGEAGPLDCQDEQNTAETTLISKTRLLKNMTYTWLVLSLWILTLGLTLATQRGHLYAFQLSPN